MSNETTALFRDVAAFLGREAMLLDDRHWHDWLELFAEDGRLWVPAWDGDDRMTDDPRGSISLIWANRTELEARIFRIEGGNSYASMPLPHTVHMVMPTAVEQRADGVITARANVMVQSFWRTHGATLRAGRYDYELVRANGSLKIRLKKITLHDDRVVGAIDIYSI